MSETGLIAILTAVNVAVFKLIDIWLSRKTTWRQEADKIRSDQEVREEKLRKRLEECEERSDERERQYNVILTENAHLRAAIERLNSQILQYQGETEALRKRIFELERRR